MISTTEAIEIARKFVESKGEIAPGICYGLSEPTDYSKCYYFDFKIIFKEPGKSDGSGFGGAPGYVVDKESGIVKTISWGAFTKLS